MKANAYFFDNDGKVNRLYKKRDFRIIPKVWLAQIPKGWLRQTQSRNIIQKQSLRVFAAWREATLQLSRKITIRTHITIFQAASISSFPGNESPHSPSAFAVQ